nr:histidine phosphatase family protein [Myxacorys almedinensis]
MCGVASTVIATQKIPAAAKSIDLLSQPGSIDAIAPSPFRLLATEQGGTVSQGGDQKPEFKSKVSGSALGSALQEGGHIIFFRHAQTDKDYADQADPKIDLKSCATQRTLSEVGWKQARMIGQAFQTLKIPVGRVFASDYCRAWQTADLAFGRYEKNSRLNFLPFEDYTDAQVAQMKAAIMPLLTAVPATGTNTVIVGHDDVFESATGIYPEPQGVAYILKPNGQEGFDLIANVMPDAWDNLKP